MTCRTPSTVLSLWTSCEKAFLIIMIGIFLKRNSAATSSSTTSTATRNAWMKMAFQYHPPLLLFGSTINSNNNNNLPRATKATAIMAERRQNFLSLEDFMEQNDRSRPFPPVLDGQFEDDSFGAFGYDPMEDDVASSTTTKATTTTATTTTNLDMSTTTEPQQQGQKQKQRDEDADTEKDNANLETIVKKDPTPIPSPSPAVIEIDPVRVELPITTHVHAGRMSESETHQSIPSRGGVVPNVFYEVASYGTGFTSTVDTLKFQREALVKTIYELNQGQEFNINSPRQVSQVLFGSSELPTNKDALDGIAGAGNRLANLILQYRKLCNDIKRLERKISNREKGTLVQSATESFRPKSLTTTETAVTTTLSENQTLVEVATTTATMSSSTTTTSAEISQDEDTDYTATDGGDDDDNDPLLLVDASAYIFRAYFSMPPIHRSDGMPVGAVMGFCNMLNRLVLNQLLEGKTPRLVLVFDSKGKTFRHDMYPQYKGNRPDAPMDLIPQFALIRQAALAYGVCQLEATAYEADDVIATLATIAKADGIDVHILSGDKDLMQLVTPEYLAFTLSRITHNVVLERWGVSPDKLGDVLALTGDSADNIPGVPGIGPKGAAALIQEFGSLECLLERVDEVKQKSRREKLQSNLEQARLSRKLIELDRTIPLEKISFPKGFKNIGDLHMEPLNEDRLLTFYDQMGLRSLKTRLRDRLVQVDRINENRKKYIPRRPKAEIPLPDDYKDVPF